ncbi:hypothetical protein HN789_01880 [archaeon]|nr:hypothetical protein [archaeon]MBT7439968.1 hypothetical protein [archaeon]
MAKKRVTKQVVKKKKWVKITSPKFLGEKELGESYVEDPNNSIGKTITSNLMKVTGDIKTQNCAVKFGIVEVKDDILRTRIMRYSFLPASIKRLVRRRMNRVDDSLVVRTKDNVLIRIKPMLLTHGKTSKAVEYSLRANLKQELIKVVNKTNCEELFSAVIKNRVQMDLKNKLNPIHPVRTVIIRELGEENHHAAKESVVGKIKVSKKATVKISEKKEVKVEAKTEAKGETKVETKVEAKLEEKKEVKPTEAKVETKVEAKLKEKKEVKPTETKPEVKAEKPKKVAAKKAEPKKVSDKSVAKPKKASKKEE